MNLAEIEVPLPWGFHDACLERLDIDWAGSRLELTLRLMMSSHQDEDQRAKVVVRGLVYCTIDPPVVHTSQSAQPAPRATSALWIDSGEGPGGDDAKARLPPPPPGCFLHWFFVYDWNAFIHICARDAELTWLEDTPRPARGKTRALFPGESIPDPGGSEDPDRS